MKKSRKLRKKIKRKLAGHQKYNKTKKSHYKDFMISSKNSVNIDKISKISSKSYSPTINKELVTLRSIPRDSISSCNLEKAYKDKEPLEINNNNYPYSDSVNSCIPYYTKEAQKILLKNLKANKHVEPEKMITPIQHQSNCWFNVLFVTFFMSDKGRKFFHFLRNLMIIGIQKDKKEIPDNLRNSFALLNFAIESCLTGNEFAYQLNTNDIIYSIYEHIPNTYKRQYPYLTGVDEAGNPLLYYIGIINYLNNNSIQLLYVEQANENWKNVISNTVAKMSHLPHIIVLEIIEKDAEKFNKKPISFNVNDATYEIDSASIIDTSKQHFCATITCENKEMAYDGASFHRLVPLKWKHKMNSDFSWQFEGTYSDENLTPMQWNFTKCYQLLMYYRVK